MTAVRPTDKLAGLAMHLPEASRVFQRHHIDFCCSGEQTLAAACAEAGLDPVALIAELQREARSSKSELEHWEDRPLGEVVAHIVDRFHAHEREELTRLVQLARQVRDTHGDADPERLERLAQIIAQMAAELTAHMDKEERVLFPWVAQSHNRTAATPVDVMHHDHNETAAAIDEIRRLTDNYHAPAGACASWRALYVALEELDGDLQMHLHIENNILIPRALAERN